MNHRHVFWIVVVAPSVAMMVFFAPKLNADVSEAKVLENIHKAKDALELANAYSELCSVASKEQLGGLKAHRHTGIALQAAWEEVCSTFPAHVRQGQESDTRINPRAMAYFLGFVEGRLRVRLPKWWRQGMAKAGYNDNKSKFDGARNIIEIPYSDDYYSPHTDDTPSGPAGTQVVKTVDSLHVTVGHETFNIPKRVLERVMAYFGPGNGDVVVNAGFIIAVPVDAKRFLLAFHMGLGDYPLFCVSRPSGKILWEATVFGADWLFPGGVGGKLPDSVVDIRVAHGVVYVFGAGPCSAYIQAFSLADGKNLFRFSTSYGFGGHEPILAF